ncbi:hypothetical protein COLO4_02075 [Corchorus olitorius]|uniref:Uncharacterized protein n=1 Tax=Corchorus olitorius TaxID=93759 RepID=A0A1R3L1K8_9ROSI|nr:hypothetical protein COLO4_02075 [Corchorus olitorius]
MRRDDEHRAQRCMRDEEVAGCVHRHAVGAAGAVELREAADLARAAVGEQRQTPDGVVTRHGHEQRGFVGRQHQTVGARAIGEQTVEPAIRAQAIHAAGRVMQASLALVGEIHIAVAGDDQIVWALEAFAVASRKKRRDCARRGVEQQQTILVVRNQQRAVVALRQAIRFAVVFRHHIPIAPRRDTQDAAMRNVDQPEIAVRVPARAFQEAIDRRAAFVGAGPFGRHRATQGARHLRKNGGFDDGPAEIRHGAVAGSACARCRVACPV